MTAPATIGRGSRRRWRTVVVNLAVAALVLFALTFLPPDNSLAEVQKSGVLRVCVPDAMPPLVTDDPARPGYDIELLELIAKDLGVRLALNHNPAIGADFNPRNWRLTRARCQVIAGGVVNNESTRGFLALLPTGLETGWSMLRRDDTLSQEGAAVGVFPGPTGLDRLALSRYLRSRKFRILTYSSPNQLARSLEDGTSDFIVSDRQTLSALQLKSARIEWVSEPELGVFGLAFGLWKGDATLMRAIGNSYRNLARAGVVEALAARYTLDVDAKADPDRPLS